MKIVITVIPESEMAYRTAGNWQVLPDGDIAVQIVEAGDERYAFLLAMHETIEAFLCKRGGVTTEDVDRYDFAHQDDDDPGLSPAAPYHDQHMVAFAVEILLAKALGVDWRRYNVALDEAWERIPVTELPHS